MIEESENYSARTHQDFQCLKAIKAIYNRNVEGRATRLPRNYPKAVSIKTRRLRDAPQKEKKLFLSYVKPYKSITTPTIGCWIVSVLTASGVDAALRAHSTKSASASKAIRAGVPIDTILQAVGWRSKSVFEQYYQKDVQVEPKNITNIHPNVTGDM